MHTQDKVVLITGARGQRRLLSGAEFSVMEVELSSVAVRKLAGEAISRHCRGNITHLRTRGGGHIVLPGTMDTQSAQINGEVFPAYGSEL